MQIAKQKLNENIAEYILYMYQIEDVIRAYQFDVDAIIERYVEPQMPDSSFINQYRSWYKDLVNQMKMQKIEKAGHLVSTQEILLELSYLHNTLLNMTKDEKYVGVFEIANKYLEEFKGKSNLKDKKGVYILEISGDSPLALLPVKEGEVIIAVANIPVSNVKNFEDQFKKELKKNTKSILLTILDSNNQSKFIGVKIK